MQVYDLCVFGAGPAGTALAARIADKGLSVVVLDRPAGVKPWGGESFTGAIRHPLSTLGEWEKFCAAGHVPGYEQRTAWGHESSSQSSLFHQHGHTWHVDRARFDDDLRESVLRRGVSIISYSRLNTIRRDDQHWHIVSDRLPEFSARYLVDATGRARAIARRLGVRPRFYDRLIALTAAVKRNPNPDFDHAMLIETTPDGWWYAAPVPQGHVLAFFTDADLAPPALKRRLRTVAANSAFAQSESSQTWLTVGDACAAHDPLCGWGVCRALTNGILAADAICGYLGIGDDSLLESYHAHCRHQFDIYLAGLAKHYALEQRWAHSIFWERRLTPISLAN